MSGKASAADWSPNAHPRTASNRAWNSRRAPAGRWGQKLSRLCVEARRRMEDASDSVPLCGLVSPGWGGLRCGLILRNWTWKGGWRCFQQTRIYLQPHQRCLRTTTSLMAAWDGLLWLDHWRPWRSDGDHVSSSRTEACQTWPTSSDFKEKSLQWWRYAQKKKHKSERDGLYASGKYKTNNLRMDAQEFTTKK